MKKLLSLLLFLLLLCIPQDAGAWGKLWLIFGAEGDDTHWTTDNGLLLSDDGDQSDANHEGAGVWSGTFDLSDYNMQNAETVWFRFKGSYDLNVGPASVTSFPLGEQVTVGKNEVNWTISPATTGYSKYSISVAQNGEQFNVTITPVVTYTINFDNTARNFSEPHVYAYNPDDALGSWPGPQMMATGNGNIYTYSVTYNVNDANKLVPDESKLIFSDNGSSQAPDETFVDGTTYTCPVTNITKTLTLVNDHPWENIYLYVYGVGGARLGSWPGMNLNTYDPENPIDNAVVTTSETGGVTTYSVSVTLPDNQFSSNLIFHNNDNNAELRKELTFVDGAVVHTASDQTFTIYFKNTAGWDNVSAYTYNSETEGSWPGSADRLTQVAGASTADKTDDVWRWSFTGYLPEAIIFNDGQTHETGSEVQTSSIGVKNSLANNGITVDATGTEITTGNADSSELTPKASGDGHDVIYQLNFGSFTSEGTIAAATAQLDYLKGKGVDVIWVMPVHPRGTTSKVGTKGSPYAATDYSAVNSEFGTIADFQTFVTTAHTKGMKVWLDWAANHTSVDHVWVTSHPEYYAKENNDFVHPVGGSITYCDVWQLDLRDATIDENDLNSTTTSAVQQAMIDEMKKWVNGTIASVDGFRCDMPGGYGGYLPTSFWTKAISQLKAVNENLDFLAETDLTHHNVDLASSGWDLDYAWNFHDELKVAANPTNVNVAAVKAAADKGALDNSRHMFYVTNHDVADGNSLKTLFGDNAYALTVMEFTLPGTPLLYHGQENGYLLNNTVTFSNDQKVDLTTHDYKMENTIKQLVNLRHSNPALADGSAAGVYVPLDTYSNLPDQVKSDQIMAYARRFGENWVLVVLNLSNTTANATVDGLLPGTWSKVLDSENIAYGIGTPVEQPIELATSLYVEGLEPHGYRIYTLSAPTNYDDGYFIRTKGHWGNTDQDLKMTKQATGSAVQDGVYTFVIDADDFDTYKSDTQVDGTDVIRFKIKEFYEYYGTIIPNVADMVRSFAKNEQTGEWDVEDPEFTILGEEKSPIWENPTENAEDKAFYFKKTDGVQRYIITLKRIREAHYKPNGEWDYDLFNTTVQVQFVNSLENTFYLHHYQQDGTTTSMVNTPMLTYDYNNTETGEDFSDVIGSDEDYQYAIVITPETFDDYTIADQYGRLFFAFQESDGQGLKGYVAPDGSVTQGRPLTETSNIDSETQYFTYENLPTDVAEFWKHAYYIKKQAGVKQYIIKLRKNNNDTYTVKVEFRKTESFKGNEVDDVLGERVYLYNVGAKKFVLPTGAWGTEAGLLFNDLGMQYILSKTPGSEQYYTVKNTVKTDWGTQLGIDDSNGQIRFYVDRSNGNLWSFNEVPGKTNTYEMVLFDQAKGGNVFAYAGNTVISNDGNVDGRSQDVSIDQRNDEVCFTQNKEIVTDGDASLEKYFQWKIVTYQELLDRYRGVASSNDTYGNANEIDGTFLLNDFTFARGNTEEWTQQRRNGNSNNFQSGTIFNKNRMGDWNLTGKYYHALIERSGKMYQEARCYVGGIYRFRCNGFSKGQNVEMYVTYPTSSGTTTSKQVLLAADQSWQQDGYSTARLANDEFDGLYRYVNNPGDDIRAGVAFMNNEYVNDLFFYIPQSVIDASATSEEDGEQTYKYVTITIGFEAASGYNRENDYTAIDNVRLHYIGRSPFVLDETKTAASAYTYNATDLAAWNNGEGTDTRVPIYLQRNFWENQWNPVVLPFDVEEDDILAAFGADTKLADPYGLDDSDPYLIKFTQIPTSEGIVAGRFYLIKPSKLDYKENVQMVSETGESYTIAGKSLVMGQHPLFGQIKKNLETNGGIITSSVFAPSDLWIQDNPEGHNGIKLFGSYFKQTTSTGSNPYVFGYNKTADRVDLYHLINNQQANLDAFRFYIADVDGTGALITPDPSGAKVISFDDLFDGIDSRTLDNGGATGINEVDAALDGKYAEGIYDLSGRKVTGINAQKDLKSQLPKGIYIVNGKKMIVR